MQVLPIIKVSIFFGMVSLLAGCYYDNKTELYPQQQSCDTANVSFATFVKPIIDKDCKTCHSGVSPVGIVPLNNHAEIAASAKSGKLYGSVSWANGFKAMPQGGNKWSSCDLLKIKSWINKGAPNN